MAFTRDEMEAAFRRHIGIDPARLDPRVGLAAMADWYRAERPLDAEPMEADGDMLLFQWSSRPDGIEVDMTRQVIWVDLDDPSDEDGELVFLQLSLAFRFPPDAGVGLERTGNRWCHSLTQLDEFLAWMADTPAYRHAASHDAANVALTLTEV